LAVAAELVDEVAADGADAIAAVALADGVLPDGLAFAAVREPDVAGGVDVERGADAIDGEVAERR